MKIRIFHVIMAAAVALVPVCQNSCRRKQPVRTPTPSENARLMYQKAVNLYDLEKYDESAGMFMQAYNDSPSYRILFNAAQAYAMAGKPRLAAHSLRRYLREGADEIEPERRAQVEQDIENLEADVRPIEEVGSGPRRSIVPITALGGGAVIEHDAADAVVSDGGAQEAVRTDASVQPSPPSENEQHPDDASASAAEPAAARAPAPPKRKGFRPITAGGE